MNFGTRSKIQLLTKTFKVPVLCRILNIRFLTSVKLLKWIHVNQIRNQNIIRTCIADHCFICCFVFNSFAWLIAITLRSWVSIYTFVPDALSVEPWGQFTQYYFRSNLVEFIFIAGSVIFSWFIPYLYALSSGLISRNCYIKNQALIQGLRIAFGHFVRVSP